MSPVHLRSIRSLSLFSLPTPASAMLVPTVMSVDLGTFVSPLLQPPRMSSLSALLTAYDWTAVGVMWLPTKKIHYCYHRSRPSVRPSTDDSNPRLWHRGPR